MELTHAQRQQRQMIRNAHLDSSVDALKKELECRKILNDKIGVLTIEEMLAECEKHGVDNFGKTPL